VVNDFSNKIIFCGVCGEGADHHDIYGAVYVYVSVYSS
jgi:hypothetical protein